MNMITGDLPLGEVFSQHLCAFWNPVTPLKLYSSPDGRELAVICSDGSTRVIDALTGSERCRFIGSRRRLGPLIIDNPVIAECAAWSPDGLHLVIGYEDGSIRIWDLASQDEQLCWEWHGDRITCLSWSPDGRTLASIGDDLALGVWEATGEMRFTYQRSEDWVEPSQFTSPYYCAFSADSKCLAVACSDASIRVLTTVSGEEIALHRCTDLGDMLSWSPVGESILLLSNQEGVVWNPFENHYQSLIQAESPLKLVTWSSDGYIALGSSEWVGMWRWEDLLEGRRNLGQAYYGKNIQSFSWLHNSTLALASEEGIRLAPVGKPDEREMGQRGDLFALKYDPNDVGSRARGHSHYMIIFAAKAYGNETPGSILARTCEHVLLHVGRHAWWGSGELDKLSYDRRRDLESARLDSSCEQER